MPHPLRAQLLALAANDAEVRAELAADGSLFEGYHPRMDAVHRANAAALRSLIEVHGWPDEELAGQDGAEAAWLIAQHAIGEPAFMRACRDLVDEASATSRVPRWHFAYLDDRIRVFEGRPQRYGTQFDLRPEGPVVHDLEDPEQVDTWREAAGLAPLAASLARASGDPLPTAEAYRDKRAAGIAWRRRVGWIT
jgi:hypothetical protein